MTKRLTAFQQFEQWCKDDHPDVPLRKLLILAVGYIDNVTDGRPDESEAALAACLRAALFHMKEDVELKGAAIIESTARQSVFSSGPFKGKPRKTDAEIEIEIKALEK